MENKLRKSRRAFNSASTHAFTRAFTLVELLVVIAIIALLISMLVPALANARRQSMSVKCKSNLKQCFLGMSMYADINKDWFAPPDMGFPDYPADKCWPSVVFAVIKLPPLPPIMLCPADDEPAQQHSYILNDHVIKRQIRRGKTGGSGVSSSDIILLGEKKSDQGDFYMEYRKNGPEFERLVEKYRHGLQLGSNYLMLDGHVESKAPKEAEGGLDPWDIAATQPADPPPP
jgi:prepilin-type N-terminal cleavage/methylation domain-containing protein/prepilin-type processing-associated H-X9-DG protein